MPPADDVPGSPARRGHRDRGSVAIEYIGFLPVLIFIALAAVQLGIAAYTASQAGTAARAAARMESLDDPPSSAAAAGAAAISDWLDAGFSVSSGDGEVTVTASVEIPSLIPGVDNFGSVERSSTMPRGKD
ncbi:MULTISPECIES: TadE/TadG family type IV pilus assembly protein [unclassified Streptomyces]|uniref:TadE/TadG family type IV pilus assembly protein n=1 Tax=unclassified Streptomyces TaxID=2593676 RepID=UPI000B25B857|nr:TadE family protein [Streptomyces sp. CNQ-509]